VHLGGVVAALAGDDRVELGEGVDIKRVLHQGHVLAHVRCLAPGLRGREEDRLDLREVVLGAHALHEHGAHHPAKADDPNPFHDHTSDSHKTAINVRAPER
jgi:hypothetical protein